MGCWVPVKASPTILPDVFTLLLNLMEPSEDMVVRLTAVLHLQHCVDTYEFDPAVFVGFLERCLDLSCGLMGECEELEVKMKVLSCLSVVVERMEKFVSFCVVLFATVVWRRDVSAAKVLFFRFHRLRGG